MTAGTAIMFGVVFLAVSGLFARNLTLRTSENPVARGIARGTRVFLMFTIPAGVFLLLVGAVGLLRR